MVGGKKQVRRKPESNIFGRCRRLVLSIDRHRPSRSLPSLSSKPGVSVSDDRVILHWVLLGAAGLTAACDRRAPGPICAMPSVHLTLKRSTVEALSPAARHSTPDLSCTWATLSCQSPSSRSQLATFRTHLIHSFANHQRSLCELAQSSIFSLSRSTRSFFVKTEHRPETQAGTTLTLHSPCPQIKRLCKQSYERRRKPVTPGCQTINPRKPFQPCARESPR